MTPSPVEQHGHRWAVTDFGLVDDRPMMRQRCACGAQRTIPAWDRTWQPRASWRLAAVDPGSPLAGRLLERSDAPVADPAARITVDVWSDIACPWCYIGKRNLETATDAFQADATAPAVEIELHSFELSPDTPVDFEGSETDYLAQHKGISREQAAAMHARVQQFGADAGIGYRFDLVKHTNTVKAHRLLHLAKAQGRQLPMAERLMAAYFSEGRHLGRDDELAALAVDVGLDRDASLGSLRDDEYLDAVRADEAMAGLIGIRGVPFFLIDDRYALQGAQPPDVFAAALRLVSNRQPVVSDTATSHP
ncbi:MAG TPA: DsbA family oxidoreductase [Candidatus Limnocylindria bacterium]|nr:DsbA family oxidoreductase [Candidatus Limnocylindria bacterium]